MLRASGPISSVSRQSLEWEESLDWETRDPPTLPLTAPSRGELPSTLADGAGATEGLLLTFKKARNVAKLFCEQILAPGQSRSDCHPHRE